MSSFRRAPENKYSTRTVILGVPGAGPGDGDVKGAVVDSCEMECEVSAEGCRNEVPASCPITLGTPCCEGMLMFTWA